MVTNHLSALLQSLSSADIHTDRWIELQCPSTRCCLRITEHNANLLTQLVDKDYNTVWFTDNRCQLSECLWHQSCLQTYMCITHITLNLLLRNKCCNRIDYDNVNRTGTYHCLSNLQCLISAVWLWNIKFINIYTDILRIYRIQCMLCIDKSRNAASFLYFCDHM